MEKRSSSQTGYLHQSQAIGELLSPEARPVVVTTGTGSGKTEAFLLPVIENAWEDATTFNKMKAYIFNVADKVMAERGMKLLGKLQSAVRMFQG